jgi:hypothetical protein
VDRNLRQRETADFEVTVTFLKPEDGGRKALANQTYRLEQMAHSFSLSAGK